MRYLWGSERHRKREEQENSASNPTGRLQIGTTVLISNLVFSFNIEETYD